MKNNKNTVFELTDLSGINTQQYIDAAHKLRNEAFSEHFGIIKNVFKRKTSVSKVKK